MNKNSLMIAVTAICFMTAKSVLDEWRKEQQECEQKLIETTTKPLVDDFIKDVQDKTTLQ